MKSISSFWKNFVLPAVLFFFCFTASGAVDPQLLRLAKAINAYITEKNYKDKAILQKMTKNLPKEFVYKPAKPVMNCKKQIDRDVSACQQKYSRQIKEIREKETQKYKNMKKLEAGDTCTLNVFFANNREYTVPRSGVIRSIDNDGIVLFDSRYNKEFKISMDSLDENSKLYFDDSRKDNLLKDFLAAEEKRITQEKTAEIAAINAKYEKLEKDTNLKNGYLYIDGKTKTVKDILPELVKNRVKNITKSVADKKLRDKKIAEAKKKAAAQKKAAAKPAAKAAAKPAAKKGK